MLANAAIGAHHAAVPYPVEAYLELTPAQAVEQWRAIAARSVLAPGGRQEPFRPVEVLLCFALFRLLDPRSYGGANIASLPPAALTLARTFRRPPGSLTNKMLNLSFDRKHGARAEPEVFLRLGLEPDRFARLHAIVLQAARDVGFDEGAVPDVLGTTGIPVLLGQDEIGSREIGLAVETVRDAVETAKLRSWFGDGATERFVEQKVRIGQHRFAQAVLRAYDHRCAFCAFAPRGLEAKGMLLASHVKPWAECANDRERLDPRNGIAACPMHDKAFDGGLLTVNGGLRIHRARSLEAQLGDRVVGSYFGPGMLRDTLLLGVGSVGPATRYLDYHKAQKFDKVG
jgi:putative restriction endonuclease